ncbi:hypothetical protein LTR08_001264 [Meristemomyces frigidus]|nr:hypothetical protein LTR08_001264 [Meristemomyces frigidus]
MEPAVPPKKTSVSTTIPPEAQPMTLYARHYLDAVGLFDKEKLEQCIELCKYNLTDPTVPRYYQIKNLLLIAGAEEN